MLNRAMTRLTLILPRSKQEYEADPQTVRAEIHDRLVSAGFGDSEADSVIGIVSGRPDTGLKIRAGVELGLGNRRGREPPCPVGLDVCY